jgi:hypothetical protein
MALIADDAADRVDQLLILTERLTLMTRAETEMLRARAPVAAVKADEMARLANAYRLEMSRIKQDHDLIAPAPLKARRALQAATQSLQAALDAHSTALSAARELTEGLARAMAEEAARLTGGPRAYGPQGGYAPQRHTGPMATVTEA